MGIDISHLDAPDLPEGEQIIEAVVLLKCMDGEGRVSYYHRYSKGLGGPETLGMVMQAKIMMETEVQNYFRPIEQEGDDE